MQFFFKDQQLDVARRELIRSGRAVALEPQVFDLLVYLIRNRDRVVSKDDLIAGVWDGRIVSDSTLTSRINAARKAVGDSGEQQALIRTIPRKGFRFVADIRESASGTAHAPSGGNGSSQAPAGTAQRRQDIGFTRTSDGVSLAYATTGDGPVLLKTANWLSHLEYDWQSPIWSSLFGRLADTFRLVRYDGRGCGLSDREVADISFGGMCRDLETVADTLKLERFALLGLSQGAATAIAYAVAHPERVSHLILYGAYSQGRNRRNDPADHEKAQALLALMRQGWGEEGSAFMRAFSSLYLPSGTPEQIKWFADMQQATTSGTMAARLRSACDDIDVAPLLPQVRVPTLVLHARREAVVPFEQGRMIAASIPNAAFHSLESENHVPLQHEPAWDELLREIESFVTRA